MILRVLVTLVVDRTKALTQICFAHGGGGGGGGLRGANMKKCQGGNQMMYSQCLVSNSLREF